MTNACLLICVLAVVVTAGFVALNHEGRKSMSGRIELTPKERGVVDRVIQAINDVRETR